MARYAFRQAFPTRPGTQGSTLDPPLGLLTLTVYDGRLSLLSIFLRKTLLSVSRKSSGGAGFRRDLFSL